MISVATACERRPASRSALIVLEFDLRPTFERIRAALDNHTKVYFVEVTGATRWICSAAR